MMPAAKRNGHVALPTGLLEPQAWPGSRSIGLDRVEVARQHARQRAFDEPMVVREIATQLLALSYR